MSCTGVQRNVIKNKTKSVKQTQDVNLTHEESAYRNKTAIY